MPRQAMVSDCNSHLINPTNFNPTHSPTLLQDAATRFADAFDRPHRCWSAGTGLSFTLDG